MIDLHTHTLLSDGSLLPSELLRRYEVLGIEVLAFTDHVDFSNIDLVVPRLAKVVKSLARHTKVKLIPGCEITHVPLGDFALLVKQARKLGARLVLGHGETPVEPVRNGTNRAAILGGVDILAHPGLIEEDDVRLAKKKGVCLEISSRAGHSLANGHVARLAKKHGAQIIFSTDSHDPEDLCTQENAENILRGSGLEQDLAVKVLSRERDWLKNLLSKR